MATQDLEQFITDFVEHIWNQQNYDKLGDFLHDDYLTHRSDGTVKGIDTFRKLVSQFHHSYPDLNVEIDNVVGSGDKVSGTYVFEGTMEEDFGSLKATGEHIRLEGSFFSRLKDGKLFENVNRWDNLNMMIQLGLIEPPKGLESVEDVLESQEFEETGERRPGV